MKRLLGFVAGVAAAVVIAMAAYPVGYAIALRLADWLDPYVSRPAPPLRSWGTVYTLNRKRR